MPITKPAIYTIGKKHVEYDFLCKMIAVQWQEGEGVVRVTIPLTPTELIIIKALLETPYCKEVDLDQAIFTARSTRTALPQNTSALAKKHVANLKAKLRRPGLTILRIVDFGYLLKDNDSL